MTVESGVEVAREFVGSVVVERTASGFSLSVKAPLWGAMIRQRDISDDNANICGETLARKTRYRPDGVEGNFRDGYGINCIGKVNLYPLLCDEVSEGVTFNFPGVYSAAFLKSVGEEYKIFLSKTYENFSRPVRIEYTITGA